jgi:hypothetical protein
VRRAQPKEGEHLTTGPGLVLIAAIVAAVGFVAIAAFQVSLALGAPLGRAAWGGAHVRLPTGLRVGSAFAALFWATATVIVLARAGYEVAPIPFTLARWGTWVLVGLLPVGALMNFTSSSPWERFLWGPVALVLAVLCLIIARSAVLAR